MLVIWEMFEKKIQVISFFQIKCFLIPLEISLNVNIKSDLAFWIEIMIKKNYGSNFQVLLGSNKTWDKMQNHIQYLCIENFSMVLKSLIWKKFTPYIFFSKIWEVAP
jgi:hypothetical protein